MIIIGNKVFRNYEEQVLKNMSDIKDLLNPVSLAGWIVVGEAETFEDIPEEGTPEFAALKYGDTYAVGSEENGYQYYIKVGGNGSLEDHWLGPVAFAGAQGVQGPAGPQGETGPQGATGEQGPKGETGAAGATGATGATGNGIQSITKTGTAGLVDTYTITFTNGTATTFTVTNGQSGTIDVDDLAEMIEGSDRISVDLNQAGDKLVIEYDDTMTDTTPTEDSSAFVTSGGIYDALADKQDRLTNVTAAEMATLTLNRLKSPDASFAENVTNIATKTELAGKLSASKAAVADVGGLVTPTAVLASNELVGVGTMTDQIRIQLGDGLELTGSTSPYTLRVVAYDGTVE